MAKFRIEKTGEVLRLVGDNGYYMQLHVIDQTLARPEWRKNNPKLVPVLIEAAAMIRAGKVGNVKDC